MKSHKRRRLLQSAALVGAGICAPARGQAVPRMPFTVAPTCFPIAGSADVFPVRRIYCIGRNYAAHAREMGSDPTREPPFFGKSFDHSAPLGPLQPAAKTGPFTRGGIWLKVNGQVKQNANLDQMIWSVAEQISKLSQAFELMPGDIVYSGTPENVGPVVKGDVMEGHIDGLPDISVRVV
jgi:2-keto-4-pentenoate hydratase/2-oxohepta-3-ene-1,7-dioic acid hydratase in catechol pathway